MTWPQWIDAVLSIARARGIDATVTYPRQGWATFNWACRNGSGYGSAGAGVEMIGLTTPEAFTQFWVCSVSASSSDYAGNFDFENRAGRYVPRIPAKATADALRILFS